MTREITIIDFEPDWAALYVDGELRYEGHQYNKEDWLKELLEEGGFKVDEMYCGESATRPWQGTPATLGEAEEMYGDD